ncbi:TVP38/TMEM64 family protein [Haloimpatiens sp. FM7315]|uniref:TVP38/TMEM64 family protein n=1 Tax=Haloimpatiens sp. FM7315 TaxID=3298609 RepID=UPI00370BB54D
MNKNNFLSNKGSKVKDNIKKIINFMIKYNKTTVAVVFVLIFIYISYIYYKYSYILKNPVEIRKFVLAYGNFSLIIFLVFQIIQVVVFFIPGELIQIAGGYVFGTFLGGVLSFLGIFLGSAMVYYISRYLGKDLVKKLVARDKFKFFDKILKASAKSRIIFLLYLIPGIPKDVLAYICGISDVSFKTFILCSTLGRVPGIFLSTYFGNKIQSGEKTKLIVISFMMLIVFAIGVIKGRGLLDKMAKKHSK